MEMLSTLAIFDDLRRCERVLTDGTASIGKYFPGILRSTVLAWIYILNQNILSLINGLLIIIIQSAPSQLAANEHEKRIDDNPWFIYVPFLWLLIMP